jgi:hypothetical protein
VPERQKEDTTAAQTSRACQTDCLSIALCSVVLQLSLAVMLRCSPEEINSSKIKKKFLTKKLNFFLYFLACGVVYVNFVININY